MIDKGMIGSSAATELPPSAPLGRRLRVAWVVPGRLDQLTGGYLYDARMVGALGARGHDVRVVELPNLRPFVDPGGAISLVRGLGGGRWDAVVVDELAHSAMVLGVPWARRRCRRRPAAFIGLVHHPRCAEPGPRPIRALAAVVERTALAGIDLAICTSSFTARQVRSLVPDGVPIRVVRPGREVAGLSMREAPPLGRWSTEPGLRVLTVAHWTPRKGIVEGLKAVALSPPDVRLDLAGDPDRDPEYARRVRTELRRPELAGRVRVHGRVSAERLAELYRDADAYLSPSSHEGYGMVLAEALVAGLPIVATAVGAVPELVRDGREAELVPRGDVVGLARALRRLAHDPAERRRRSDWARERAASLPGWDESGATFADIVAGAVERVRAG